MRLLAFLNVPPERILTRLRGEKDPGIQYALLISLGDYKEQQILRFDEVRGFIGTLHRDTPDAGVHSAAEWLLRRWGVPQPAANLTAEPAETALHGPTPPRQWLKSPRLGSCDGHTLIRVAGKTNSSVGHDFLIAAHEVTVQQAHEFDPALYNNEGYSRTPDSPMSVVRWRNAAGYCNWCQSVKDSRSSILRAPEHGKPVLMILRGQAIAFRRYQNGGSRRSLVLAARDSMALIFRCMLATAGASRIMPTTCVPLGHR